MSAISAVTYTFVLLLMVRFGVIHLRILYEEAGRTDDNQAPCSSRHKPGLTYWPNRVDLQSSDTMENQVFEILREDDDRLERQTRGSFTSRMFRIRDSSSILTPTSQCQEGSCSCRAEIEVLRPRERLAYEPREYGDPSGRWLELLLHCLESRSKRVKELSMTALVSRQGQHNLLRRMLIFINPKCKSFGLKCKAITPKTMQELIEFTTELKNNKTHAMLNFRPKRKEGMMIFPRTIKTNNNRTRGRTQARPTLQAIVTGNHTSGLNLCIPSVITIMKVLVHLGAITAKGLAIWPRIVEADLQMLTTTTATTTIIES
ncbi:hypothetical protein Tco_0752813 [Tanacetum coccineum]|uniref:Uncharacterized protein n=1 Tax=Tanacetum coccineum TaxID=301880 RepID=A0ABQ4ZAT9_9ASTR